MITAKLQRECVEVERVLPPHVKLIIQGTLELVASQDTKIECYRTTPQPQT